MVRPVHEQLQRGAPRHRARPRLGTGTLHRPARELGGGCERHNLAVHAANSVLMVLEMALNNLPMRKAHFLFCGWWAACYGVFNIFVLQPIAGGHAAAWTCTSGHCLVYPFMSMHEPPRGLGVVLWMCGLCALHGCLYFVARAVVMAKTLGCVAFCVRCDELPPPSASRSVQQAPSEEPRYSY